MPFQIDGVLYPDVEPPSELVTLGDQACFLARLCATADFGLLPNRLLAEIIATLHGVCRTFEVAIVWPPLARDSPSARYCSSFDIAVISAQPRKTSSVER